MNEAAALAALALFGCGVLAAPLGAVGAKRATAGVPMLLELWTAAAAVWLAGEQDVAGVLVLAALLAVRMGRRFLALG